VPLLARAIHRPPADAGDAARVARHAARGLCHAARHAQPRARGAGGAGALACAGWGAAEAVAAVLGVEGGAGGAGTAGPVGGVVALGGASEDGAMWDTWWGDTPAEQERALAPFAGAGSGGGGGGGDSPEPGAPLCAAEERGGALVWGGGGAQALLRVSRESQDTATQRWTAGALHALCKAALEEAWGNLLFECIIAARGVQVPRPVPPLYLF